jgi:hypothetical protein
LAKENVTTSIKGDQIGGNEDEEHSSGTKKGAVKTPKKAEASNTTKEPGSSETDVKKRKAAEMEEEQTESKTEPDRDSDRRLGIDWSVEWC